MKTAIILGATGLTGGHLLNRLLKDEGYGKVKLFSRSSAEIEHPKIEEHLGDLFNLQRFSEAFTGEEVFVCVGTTKKKTPNKETYRNVDYGIPVNAARLAKRNGILKFLVISAMGADSESRIFYNRTKGEMERDVLKASISETYILQPSLISGDRKENRPLEDASKMLMKVLNKVMLGPLKKYRSIHPDEIAAAMLQLAQVGHSETRIASGEIKKIAKQ